MAEASENDGFSDELDDSFIRRTNQVVNRKNRGGFVDLSDVKVNAPSMKLVDCEGDCLLSNRSQSSSVDSSYFTNASSVSDVVCVFVVAFDTRAGNMIEWCVPNDVDLEDIEFKAMASGSHRITYDFIYFKKGRLFGLSCFENMPVDSQLERGARMKSVGVLASSYGQLHHYKSFLETQVKLLLKSPGYYDQLRKFYDENKGILPNSKDRQSIQTTNCDLTITHPAGCFSQFVRFFGEQVFVLWKFALLQKRILFFSPPPIGVVCYRVYCTNCLSNYDIPELGPKTTNILFYVNVADIDMLEEENNYIACTTERIFEAKPQLYDVFVDNQNVHAQIPVLKDMLSPTTADKANFTRLCNIQRDANLFSGDADEETNEEDFVSFFAKLNNELFRTLLEISETQEKLVTADDIRRLGLDPNGDRVFLMELVELYGIDVVLPSDNPCCPT